MSPKHLNVIKTHIRMHVFAIYREETRNIKQGNAGVSHTDIIRLPRGFLRCVRTDVLTPVEMTSRSDAIQAFPLGGRWHECERSEPSGE